MPDGDGGEVIVTGTRLPDDDDQPMFYWDWGWNGSTPLLFPEPGSGGESPTPEDGVHDIRITETATTPKIEIHGVTAAQEAKVLNFLAQAHHDPRVAASMQEMHDKGVTLRISFVDVLPPVAGFEPDSTSRAQTHFQPLLSGFDSNSPQEFQPGSTVYIEIDRDMISNQGWETSLEGILAHEFTHLLRDADGHFILDNYHGGLPGNSAQDYDNSVYQNIYGFDPDNGGSGGQGGDPSDPPPPAPPPGGGGPGGWYDEPPINSIGHIDPGVDQPLNPIIWAVPLSEVLAF